MRLLYLCHRIPYPPDKGEKIRAFRQVRALQAGHEVDVFTLADDNSDLAQAPALRRFCRRLVVAPMNRWLSRLRALPALLGGGPMTLPYFHSAELARQIRAELGQRSYDRIVVYCSAMSQYVSAAEIPVLTDFVDVDSDKWTQYAGYARFPLTLVYRREGRTLRRYERKVCEESSAVVVTTDREAALVREISAAAPVYVVPNGVDTEYFKPAQQDGAVNIPTIGFTGDMGYFPNQNAVIHFASRVFPLVRQSTPAARFLIVGRNPGRAVLALGEIPGVEVTGFVPDVRPYLERMHVSVAPFLIAAGIQNKILEAMASCVPVVATSRAAQGLSRGAAAAVQIADDPADMAGRIAQLLGDARLRHTRGQEARQCVMAEYNWETALGRFLELVEQGAVEKPKAIVHSSNV